MTTTTLASWGAVLALGAMHGANPAMGWLFAVARGLQSDRRALLATLAPLALGHALAIALVLVIAASIGLVIPISVLKWVVAAMLLMLGLFQLRGHYHPRSGMQVGAGALTVWSFLVASAHGAGLMALPFVVKATGMTGMHHAHGAPLSAGVAGPEAGALLATLLHTVGYLAITALIALLAYEKLGLRFLRTAWINVNLLWALTLIATALLTPFV